MATLMAGPQHEQWHDGGSESAASVSLHCLCARGTQSLTSDVRACAVSACGAKRKWGKSVRQEPEAEAEKREKEATRRDPSSASCLTLSEIIMTKMCPAMTMMMMNGCERMYASARLHVSSAHAVTAWLLLLKAPAAAAVGGVHSRLCLSALFSLRSLLCPVLFSHASEQPVLCVMRDRLPLACMQSVSESS